MRHRRPTLRENPRVIVFHHIYKTAGTSLRAILENQLGLSPKQSAHRRWDQVGEIPPKHRITLLREPVDRAVSHYNHAVARWSAAAWARHEIGADCRLEEFAVYSDRFLGPNQQVAFLAGCPFDAISRPLLDRAKANLKRCYWFGFTETLASDLESLSRLVGKPLKPVHHNSGPPASVKKIPANTRRIIELASWADLELYRFAKVLINN